ncbi:MAG: D-alanyl-D-alanine carboxypeptidase [Alphaproteobacteria bacterium]|nr:D-alanyl-D-alanine carboxypeptidase [Alphaproteobacteria bacterium]
MPLKLCNFLNKITFNQLKILLILSFFGVSYLITAQTFAAVRYESIIVNAQTGNILFESNANLPTYPASLTKMMTLLLLFEALEKGQLRMDQNIVISERAASKPATNMNVKTGARMNVETAIKAIIIRSANDIACAIAETLAGSEENFAKLMTAKAKQIGMIQTVFRNASGLPDSGQITSARDMATLALTLMREYPAYYPYFSERAFSYQGRKYTTHNRILNNYAGADGLKTGFIRASGFNLVSSAKRNGQRLIGVVLGGESASWRDKHMMRLFDRGFSMLQNPSTSNGTNKTVTPPPGPFEWNEANNSKASPVPVEAEGDTDEASSPYETPKKAAPPKITKPPISTGKWSVSVGSYKLYNSAMAAAKKALQAIPANQKSGALVKVDTIKQGKGRVYRARIGGLVNKDKAQSICTVLKSKKQSCAVLQLS